MEPGDGLDNDCDGRIDEETLDRRDNDGDGEFDEDLELVSHSVRPIWWFLEGFRLVSIYDLTS